MAHSLRIFTIGLLVSSIMLSCASTPPAGWLPAKESADDCLVLLPMEVKNNTSTTNARKYAYVFSGDYGTLGIPDYSGYIVLVTHEPGVVLEKLKTYIAQGQGIVGKSGEWAFNYKLPYEPGKMVVAPFMFAKRIESDNAGGSTSYTDIVKVEDTKRQEILSLAAEQENAATWEK